MANEYLKRTPTSTGNRRVWTASLWYKMSSAGAFFGAGDGSNQVNSSHWWFNSDQLGYSNNDGTDYVTVLRKSRDFSSWSHYMLVVDTTKVEPYDRVVFYENGVRNEVDTTSGYTNPSRNEELSWINQLWSHHIGARNRSGANTFSTGEYTDIFFIDGQALTPDVFGFYKVGKGYVSVGSTQATDFRPGQWVPKTPRVIKTAINNNGGFGVNGFYLPMNDSNNFGADFHCDPNSIIKLQENLPQPRCRIDGVGDYTGALRDDPFKQYLVLALPFVSGGLQSGFGDYSAAIKGSGSAKTLTLNGGVGIANTASYYGSSSYFDGNGDYLRTSTNISDFQFGTGDFTIETWLWKSANGVNNYDAVATLGTDGSATDGWFLEVSATRGYLWYVAGSSQINYNVSPNTSQWNHLAVCRKANTTTMYLNGVAVGINTNTYTVPATATTLDVGVYAVGTGNYWFNGYIQDLRIYKGVAKYTGGFDVPRPYTPVGIATWRAVPDSPANNFATMNPLIGATPRSGGTITSTIVTYTDGNLTTRNSANAGYAPAMQSHSNVGMTTGKWYWEASNFSTTSNEFFGISKGNEQITPSGGGTGIECNLSLNPSGTLVLSTQYDGNSRISATLNNSPGTGISSTSDVIGFAFDVTNSSLSVYRNGVLNNTATGIAATSNVREWFVTKSTSSSGTGSGMSWNFGQNSSFSGNTTAGTYTDSNNKGLFKYQPPSGFLALCEDNLPTPAISDPGKYFKTVLWTGDGNTTKNVVGVGFTPDLVWIKGRTSTSDHSLIDSVRGKGVTSLSSNQTYADNDYGLKVLSFDSDGFSTGTGSINFSYTNNSGGSYVAWCWKAGAGTTSTNTNGSITSVVSVNQDAGFSIVSWTGNGSSTATVGHGLGKVPAFLISKARGGTNDWWVVHKSGNGNLQLNTTSALITSGGANGSMGFPSTLTSSIFTFTNGASSVNNVNQNGITYIAYCWAEIEGFSKFGSYVGNNSTDGPFVFTNGKPAFVMIKRTDSTANWFIFDNSRNSTNPNLAYLVPNAADIESSSGGDMDFLSNGFKIRNTSASLNASGGTYIFACWMESPFTTANSK